MDLTGKHIIAGETSQQEPPSFTAVDPATGEELSPGFSNATTLEIDDAVTAARDAAHALDDLPRTARAELLEACATAIEGLGDALLQRAHRETALPLARLTSERGRTVSQMRMFAEVVREGSFLDLRIDRAQPDRQPLPKPDVRSMLRGIGPVAVFGASNFPLAFSVGGGDTVAAFAAGCPVIVKAHPHHPGTGEMVARAITDAVRAVGLPAGTFSLLHGRTTYVGQWLVQHPDLKAVGFTGSQKGGRALVDLASRRPDPIPVFAEMGSVNPVFVLPLQLEVATETLAETLGGAVTLGVGQFCTNPGVIVLPKGDAADRFLDRLEQLFVAVEHGTMLHAALRQTYEQSAERLASVRGVEARMGSATGQGAAARPWLFVTSAKTFLSEPATAHEVFGPATLCVLCDSFDEMLQVARGLEGQLTATVHAVDEELDAFARLADVLRHKAGRIIRNGVPTGVEVCDAMQHGGPYPASSDARFTSVGTAAARRFQRPVSFQNWPAERLPAELADDNPEALWRRVDGAWSRE